MRAQRHPNCGHQSLMNGRIAIVTGTGTGIGKTHVAVALVRALRASGQRALGLKPIESGIREPELSDHALLAQASSFHVKHLAYRFSAPLSPHLAARETGVVIDLDALTEDITRFRAEADTTVVELAGGLFKPLSATAVNADLLRRLQPDLVLLVAPDRLGVLHDVLVMVRAAHSIPVSFAVVVVNAQETEDASTGRNAHELRLLLADTRILSLSRGTIDKLSRDPGLVEFVIQEFATPSLSVRLPA